MLRRLSCAFIVLSIASAQAAAVGDNQQCVRDLAGVDRSFADAMRDLQRNAASDARCTSWRRQIDVMKKASGCGTVAGAPAADGMADAVGVLVALALVTVRSRRSGV